MSKAYKCNFSTKLKGSRWLISQNILSFMGVILKITVLALVRGHRLCQY